MKKWYADPTVIVNILMALMGIGTLVSKYMTDNPVVSAPGIILLIVGCLGVVLRVFYAVEPIETPKRLAAARYRAELTGRGG